VTASTNLGKLQSANKTVIQEIEAKLFPRDESQVEHSSLMFKDFEEKMRFLEKWLERDVSDENYMKFSDTDNFEKKIKMSYSNDIVKKKMQQLVSSININFQQTRSNMYQQGYKLDMEIDRIRMLMMKVPRMRKTNVKRKFNNMR
jgi:hypothetical protein